MVRTVTRNGFHKLSANRTVLGSLLGCLALLLFVGCSGTTEETTSSTTQQATTASSSTTTKPNIIFILTDDLDYASAPLMPKIYSSLAQQGTTFEEDFVSHAVCCPSRATILTGLYDHNHGVKGDLPPDGGFQKFFSEGIEKSTIATRLQKAGYQTALFGKYLNDYPGDNDPTYVPPGWDEWYAKMDKQKLYNYRINENGHVAHYGNSTEDFFTDVLSGQVTDFVRRKASDPSPFFMYIAPTAPHTPATPARRYKNSFADAKAPRPPSFNEEDVSDKPPWISNRDPLTDVEISQIDALYRKRLASMLAVDDLVSSLIQELEASGKLGNTFIFFTSDNGWEQGEHRIPKGKNFPYEESVHMPLYVRGPGVPAGSKIDNLVLNTDFAPTFAELAGIQFSADGRSLAPLLRGETPAWRSGILLERLPRTNNNTEGTDEEGTNEEASEEEGGNERAQEGIRTDSYKYIEYESGDKQLYDLKTDPYEMENIYPSADSSLLANLKMRLDELKNCSGEGCQEAENAS
jgi:N-acetylglucosamine-6-sulfatase